MAPRDPFAPWDEDSSPGLSPSSGPSDPFRPWSGPEYLTPFEQLDQERARKAREQLLSIGVDPNLASTIGDAGLLGMTRYHQLTEGSKQNDAIMAGLEQPYDPAEPSGGPWGAGADMLRQIPAGGVEGLSNVMFGMPQGILRAAAETYDEDALFGSPETRQWLDDWANAYGEAHRALSGEAPEIAPPPTDLLGKAARATGPSAAIMLPFAAGPQVGIPAAYAQIFADEINTAYERGEDIDERRVGIASLSSALQSFIEVAGGPERALAAGVARAGNPIQFLKNLGKMAAGEGLEEGAQSAVNLAGRFAAGEFEGQDPTKVIADWLPSVGEEMMIGAILGGVMGAPVQVAEELGAAEEQKAIDDATGQIDASFQEAIQAAYGPEGIPGAGSAPLAPAPEGAPDPNLPLDVAEAAAPVPEVATDPFRPWTDEAVEPQELPLQSELEATGTENLLSEPLRGPQEAPTPEAAGASSEAPIAAGAPTEAAPAVESPVQGELFTPEGEVAPEPPVTLDDFAGRLRAAGRPDEEVSRAVDLVERFAARQGVSPDELLATTVADLRTGRTQEEMRAGPPGLERQEGPYWEDLTDAEKEGHRQRVRSELEAVASMDFPVEGETSSGDPVTILGPVANFEPYKSGPYGGKVDPGQLLTADASGQRAIRLASQLRVGGSRLVTPSPRTREEGSRFAERLKKTGGPTTLERAAYHGSPYEFDRFDSSKAKTGAYGYGLNFTTREAVADYFKNRPAETDGATPRRYKVDLKVQDDEWLDWNQPFDRQSLKVQKALRNAFSGRGFPREGEVYLSSGPSGEAMYRALQSSLGTDKATSEALLAEGIRGNRFVDPNQRFIEEGAESRYSYTLFSDRDVEIESFERNDGRFVHGRVVFDPDRNGKAVIDIAEGADGQAVAEELVHTFRRNLATEDLAEAERLLGVKDGNWTVEKEELFAKKVLGALENQRITGFWRKMADLFRQWAESVREFVTGELREDAVGRGFRKFVDTFLGKGEGQFPAVAKSRGAAAAPDQEQSLERRTFRSTKSGVPKGGIKGFLKEWFTYEGVRSSKAVEIIEDSYQKRDAAHLAALGEAKALIHAIGTMPEEEQIEAWGKVADYLATSATDVLQDLPKPVRALAKRFRDKTDKMSTEIANRPGMVSDTLASVILGQAAELSDETGIGRYQTRTFRAFRDENWHKQIKQTPLWNALVPKVKKVLIDNAREHLVAAYGANEDRKGLSPDEIEAVMDYIVGTTPNLKTGGFVTPPLKRGEANLGKRYFEEDVERHRRAIHDVEGWMDSTLLQARNEMTSPRGQGIGTILTGIYKRRKDIPEAIRQLLGEDTNAAIRYLHTMEALTRNLANHEMYELLLDNGLSEGWASISPRAGFVRFPGVESRNPMAGTEGRPIYVHKKVAEALTDRETSGQAEAIRTISGLVKMGLTVGSIQTQSRNMLSNVVFMLGAGALTSPKYLKAAAGVLWKSTRGRGAGEKKEALDAVERLREDVFMGASDEEIHGALVKMRELGVTGTSIDVRDVHYFLRGLADDLDPDLQFTDWKKRAASKSWSWVKSGARKATNLYQLGDDMFKVARFMQEMSRLQYHSPELVQNNRAEAEKRAAAIVKDTMPNYDRLSKFMRALKRNRLFGPFISFAAEVPRVTLNQFLQAKYEIREGLTNGNQKMVATGAHRLASQAFAIGFLPGIAAAIARALFGMDDDEQTAEDKSALRSLIPHFMQNGQPIFLRREDGTFFVFDWGFMDPYAVIKRPFFGAVRNGALGLAEELSDVYLGEELIVAPAIDIIRNRKRSGGQVFPEGGSVGANLAIASGHLLAAGIPGIGNTLSRNVRAWAGTETDWGRKYDPWAEAIAVLGPRIMRIGAKEALGWEARAYMRRVQSAREGERRGKPKETENENWLATLVYAADNALRVPQAISGEAAFVTAARDLSRAIAGARTAGLDDKEIIAALKEARLPKDDLSAAFKSVDELAIAAKQRSVRRSRSYSRRGARR